MLKLLEIGMVFRENLLLLDLNLKMKRIVRLNILIILFLIRVRYQLILHFLMVMKRFLDLGVNIQKEVLLLRKELVKLKIELRKRRKRERKKKELKAKIEDIFDKGKKRKFSELEGDPKFQEFMSVALSNKKTQLWQNDDIVPDQFIDEPNVKKRRINEDESDSEEYQMMPESKENMEEENEDFVDESEHSNDNKENKLLNNDNMEKRKKLRRE